MKQLILIPDIINKLEEAVNDYMITTRVRAVIIINTAGQLIFKTGIKKSDNFMQSFSALSAGIFNATVSIAKLIGDDYFENILQEGKRINLYYSAVNNEIIIITAYNQNAIIGVINVMNKKLKKNILDLMTEDDIKIKKQVSFDNEYKDEVENLLDNMFK